MQTIHDVVIKKNWDYTPDRVTMDNRNPYIVPTRARSLLVDLLHRGTNGAFLLSGRRGVGKTSQVLSAIEEVVELEKRSRSSLRTLAITIDATKFEIFYRDAKDSNKKEVDTLKTKGSILKNLIVELNDKVTTKQTQSTDHDSQSMELPVSLKRLISN